MTTANNKSIHPMMMIAGVAVIVFSAAGVAAIMGWIPSSFGHSSESAQQPKLSGNAATHKAPGQTARNNVAVPAKCAECGVIESVQQVENRGEGSGAGAVGGAVVGGLLGHQVGGGRGKDVMTVVGAVGGAVAGNQIEKHVRTTTAYVITVRFDNGSSRVFNVANAPTWQSGDKVKVINDTIQSNA